MRVYLSSDHGGFDLKAEVAAKVAELGHQVIDCGNTRLDPMDDYPDFIIPMAEQLITDPGALGIVLGRSGNGEQIAANKVRGIRAALCMNITMAEKARQHNEANVLALGGDYIDTHTALRIVEMFLTTLPSVDQRHRRRVEKIIAYENRQSA
jgi:ribose 5-phosphate isomerase B